MRAVDIQKQPHSQANSQYIILQSGQELDEMPNQNLMNKNQKHIIEVSLKMLKQKESMSNLKKAPSVYSTAGNSRWTASINHQSQPQLAGTRNIKTSMDQFSSSYFQQLQTLNQDKSNAIMQIGSSTSLSKIQMPLNQQSTIGLLNTISVFPNSPNQHQKDIKYQSVG